jgi:predicted transposase YdaD
VGGSYHALLEGGREGGRKGGREEGREEGGREEGRQGAHVNFFSERAGGGR